MKKILALILALACVFSFAACASKSNDDTIGADTSADSAQQPETPRPVEEPEAPVEEPEAPAEEPAETPVDDGAVVIDTPAVMPDDGFLVEGPATQEPAENTPAPEGGVENADSAKAVLDLLNNVWATYTDDEKFPAAGGDYDNNVDSAPGRVDISNAETVSYLLTFPESDVAKLDGAASLLHMMNGNTFTCGAFHVASADDVSSIAEDIHTAISGKHWMCGFPEKMLIATSGSTIVAVYGNEDLVNTFRDKLFAQDSGFTAVYDEAISA